MTQTTKQIKKEIRKVIKEQGKSAAFELAKQFDLVLYEFCRTCNTDSLTIEHECLMCGEFITDTQEDRLARIKSVHAKWENQKS